MKKTASTTMMMVFLANMAVFGSYDIHLTGTDIQGESTVQGHVGAVELSSVSLDAILAAASRQTPGDTLKITKETDLSTVDFMAAGVNGGEIENVTIEFSVLIGGGQSVVFLKVEMGSVSVTEVDLAATADGSAKPYDEITLMFSSITVTYSKFNPTTGFPTDQRMVGWTFD